MKHVHKYLTHLVNKQIACATYTKYCISGRKKKDSLQKWKLNMSNRKTFFNKCNFIYNTTIYEEQF